MKHPLVSVVIPVWNVWSMTRECLESLAAHTPPGLLEVLVVDNGSTDATAQELEPLGQALFKERFKAIRFAENRGFAIASNEGARQGICEILLLLNNDTLALPGWLPPLLEAFASAPAGERLGAAGPLLLYEGGERVQHCGVAFSYGGVQHIYGHFPANHPAVLRSRRLQAMTAAALMLPRALFMELGLLHEGYRNGFEDLDLCRSLSRAGYSLRCVPQSCVVHRESSTPGRKDHDPANAALYGQRWPEPLERDLYRIAREDGFAVSLNETLETYLCLPPRKEAELNRMAASLNTIPALWDVLRAHPVWQGGYEYLAKHLNKSGRSADTLFVRVLQSQFFSSAENSTKLAEAAQNAGNMSLAADARSDALRRVAALADAGALQKKAAVQSRYARRDGLLEVEALYLEWLKRHGL